MTKTNQKLPDTPGTVTMPLASFLELRESQLLVYEKLESIQEMSRQLAIFLSGLASEKVVYDEIARFNARSRECEIHIIDGRVKIELKDL